MVLGKKHGTSYLPCTAYLSLFYGFFFLGFDQPNTQRDGHHFFYFNSFKK